MADITELESKQSAQFVDVYFLIKGTDRGDAEYGLATWLMNAPWLYESGCLAMWVKHRPLSEAYVIDVHATVWRESSIRS